MAIKRCNYCVLSNGQGFELSLGQGWVCGNCGCAWQPSGYHAIGGKVNGKACAYPQPQDWSNDAAVVLQHTEAKKR
jgi:hypothetical protein